MNEFVIKNGFISKGDSIVNGTISGDTLNLTTIPSNDNSQTQVLVRNNTTGLVEYRDASSLSGTSGVNTFVTGTTFGSNQSITRRNDGSDVLILTGGTNVTLSNPSTNQIKFDVNIPAGMNTYVTGFTYNDNNTFTIFDNDGGSFPATFNQVSGLTVNGDLTVTGTSNLNVVTATTLDGSILLSGGTNLTTVIESLDTYVTGGTVSVPATDNSNDGTIGLFYKNFDGTPRILPFKDTFTTGSTYDNGTALATFDRNDGTSYTLDLSTIDVNDTFITGFTYNDANTLTISRNDGVDLSTSINTMTGLTVNGTLVVDTLSATTYTGLTLNDLDDVTTNIPPTPDNSYQGELIYFDVASNQWVSGEEYGNLGEVTIWGKKGSAGTIDKGCPVYIVGFDDDIHEVELANATTATTMPVIGFTAEDFDNAGVYPIVTFGKITGLDTSSATTVVNPFGETWEVNDVLYMAKSDGGLTKFRPSGTDTQIQRISKVLKVGTTDGQLFIFNTARTAGLPNLTTDYLWVGNGNDTPQELIRTDVGITTTGFTYNNNNTLSITDDNGGTLTTTINQMSGLTINGDLDVTGDTILGPLTATSITSNSAIDVFNGHINIRDNSYFLQGRTVADVNVSLIGVDNQDRVFVGNAGYDTYIDSDTIVDGVLSAQTTFLTTTPTLNNSATDILVRNSSTGEVEYRPVSGITPDTNTFVTGTTFSSNQSTLTRNDDVDVLKITGDTNVVLSNPSTNQIKIGLDLGIKSGFVSGTDFTGNPKTYKVMFTTPYSNDEYSINITGGKNRTYTYQNKTAASFVINANANTLFTEEVNWITIKYGEQ